MAAGDESVEPATSSFYYPSLAQIAPDGSFAIQASWWDNGGHTSGALLIEPDHSDYEFSRWLVANVRLFPQVNDENVAAAREAFANRD
jgi:hypothetical protein